MSTRRSRRSEATTIQSGISHTLFKTLWPGDPRVNNQNDKGKAKAYQVRQVLLAIDKLKKCKNDH